jgi:hypothetical protein
MHVDETREHVPARQIEDGGAARGMITGSRENSPYMSAFDFDRAPCVCDTVYNVDYGDVIEDQ